MEICEIKDCEKKAHCQGLCSMHYARRVRTGTTDKISRALPGDTVHNGGNYLLTHAPDHPLRKGKANRVYAHRIVFYDAHGEGPFQCHHCGKQVDWSFMHVDHLDDDTQNNEITNLVASCPVCNQKRGFHKSKAANKARGQWVEYGALRLPIADFAKAIGMSMSGLRSRLTKYPLWQAVLLAPGSLPVDQTVRLSRLRQALNSTAEKHQHNGRSMTTREWAEYLGVPIPHLANRIRKYGAHEGISGAGVKPKAPKRAPKAKRTPPPQFTYGGQTQTTTEWAKLLGVKRKNLDYRIRKYGVEIGIGEASPSKQFTLG